MAPRIGANSRDGCTSLQLPILVLVLVGFSVRCQANHVCVLTCRTGLPSIVTPDLFNSIFPNRTHFYSYDSFVAAAALFPMVFECSGDMQKQDIAAFFAHVAHETNGLKKNKDDSNNQTRYYGRGPLQLTGVYNYKQCGLYLDEDLVNHPDLLATNPNISWESAMWLWTREQMLTTGSLISCEEVMDGNWKPSKEDITCGWQPGFGETIGLINGVQECGPDAPFASAAADRVAQYQRICVLLGVDPGNHVDCINLQPYCSPPAPASSPSLVSGGPSPRPPSSGPLSTSPVASRLRKVSKINTLSTIVLILGGFAILATIVFVALCLLRAYRYGCSLGWREFQKTDVIIPLEGLPTRFSYKQLSVATKAFSEESKLGQGGFGCVYFGVLTSSGTSTRIPVAVKKINNDSKQGGKEFMAEVSIISRLRHRNLIQLFGWCKDDFKRQYLLVYELMPNGSLDKVLFEPAVNERSCLSWSQRFNIVRGTAAALDYLHQGWKQQVLHRDIKSSNIMLDEEWNAKLGDFGLARLVDHQREANRTDVVGTLGYLAPEVAVSGKFTDKSDVFAFGAVVLEIACGRQVLNECLPEDETPLLDWVWQKLSEGDLMKTVDERLEEYDTYWMQVMLKIGLLCSHPNPLARPTMRHVVQILAGEAPLPSIPASKPDIVYSTDHQWVSIEEPHSQETLTR